MQSIIHSDLEVVRDPLLRLAPLLLRAGMQVCAHRDGTVEVRSPLGSRMNQEVALGDRDGVLWWHWVWSGPSGTAPEYEPICPGDDIDELARRLCKVLAVSAP